MVSVLRPPGLPQGLLARRAQQCCLIAKEHFNFPYTPFLSLSPREAAGKPGFRGVTGDVGHVTFVAFAASAGGRGAGVALNRLQL